MNFLDNNYYLKYSGKINYIPQTNLFITDQFGVCDLTQLQCNNIKYVFNVSPVKLREYDGINYYNLPILDDSNQNIIQFFDEIFTKFDEIISKGNNIVINCQAGVSRSASFIIGYLIKKGMTYENSYELVKSCRPIIKPNRNFIEQLKNYEKTMKR